MAEPTFDCREILISSAALSGLEWAGPGDPRPSPETRSCRLSDTCKHTRIHTGTCMQAHMCAHAQARANVHVHTFTHTEKQWNVLSHMTARWERGKIRGEVHKSGLSGEWWLRTDKCLLVFSHPGRVPMKTISRRASRLTERWNITRKKIYILKKSRWIWGHHRKHPKQQTQYCIYFMYTVSVALKHKCLDNARQQIQDGKHISQMQCCTLIKE